ncbi:hypothetical protein BV25DRAFT_639110 [Artomyces pyxidatus]|uniref:Uncharacterized protein n=1 Tax=Artomyces pyxidatus TaxID=48021 RepID=A0ACB8T292_9AGAM|nr:hypothetical protein BV25DRAFT_639110 [Artomyces pyxidatus]
MLKQALCFRASQHVRFSGIPRRPWRALLHCRQYNSATAAEAENLSVAHSRFLADSPASSKWKDETNGTLKPGLEGSAEDFDSITEGKGKLSPTSSHLFKLILPLGDLASGGREGDPDPQQASLKAPPPTVFLLHPSQPLTHVSRLVASALPAADPDISFRSASPSGQRVQWSGSTDVGDFVRDVARATEFTIHIAPAARSADDTVITVEVPSFADRTRFLRSRLEVILHELQAMEGLKRTCDHEARRGARRMAVSGLGMLVVYWGAVARLTFWDYGWDVMEPITYLSGLSTVICGYLWFLYQGREVTYSSVLDRSISSRRRALYKTRGFDIERWHDLVAEARGLRKEIGQIARDYDQNGKRGKEEDNDERIEEEIEEKNRAVEEENQEEDDTMGEPDLKPTKSEQ